MSIVVITSTEARHHFLVTEIAKTYNVEAVILEPKVFNPRGAGGSEEDCQTINKWFEASSNTEKHFFSNVRTDFAAYVDQVYEIEAGDVNTPETIRKLQTLAPQVLVAFGSSILSPAVLATCSGVSLNLHLGISPFYRGSATNFWALHDGRPGLVGATVHILDYGVDSGPIVYTGRPNMTPQDTPHTLGCKAIEIGVMLMLKSLAEYFDGTMRTTPQSGEPLRLCRRRDFSAQSIRNVQAKMKDGLITRFIENGSPGHVQLIHTEYNR